MYCILTDSDRASIYLLQWASSNSFGNIPIYHGINGPHHVDHLIPLNGPTVVQIVPRTQLLIYSVLSNLHLKCPGQLHLWGFGCYQIIGHNELVENIRLLEL